MSNDGKIKLGVEIDKKDFQSNLDNLKKNISNNFDDIEKTIDSSLNEIKNKNRKTFEEMAEVTGKSVDDIKKEVDELAKKYQEQGLIIPASYKKAYADLGLIAKKGTKNVSEEGKDLEKKLKKNSENIEKDFKEAFSGFGDIAKKGFGAVATAGKVLVGGLTAVGGSLVGVAALTEEYRYEQAKLNTAFESAGYSTELAQKAYQNFYSILGEEDTAVEASQLLAKLSLNAQDMDKWFSVATGVLGTFGDALPIEGLIESANETAKVGEVTGNLADALNWAGISEDEFNDKLASLGTEAERNQLILSTLTEEYQNASDIFNKNNSVLIEARQNQALLTESLSGLGEKVTEVGNRAFNDLAPSLITVIDAFTKIADGSEEGKQQLSIAITDLINVVLESLPKFIITGTQILLAVVEGFAKSIIENKELIFEKAKEIANTILDGIADLIPELEPVTEAIKVLGENMDKVIPIVVGLTAAMVTYKTSVAISGIISKLSTSMQTLKTAITAVNTAIKANPIGLLISLITGAIATIITLIATNEDFRNAFLKVWEKIKTWFVDFVDSLREFFTEKIPGFFNGLVDKVKDVIEDIKKLGSQIWDSIFGGFGGKTKTITQPILVNPKIRGIGEPLNYGLNDTEQPLTRASTRATTFDFGFTSFKKTESVLLKQIKELVKNAGKVAEKEAKSFEDTGEILINNIASGVESKKESAISQVQELVDQMTSSANSVAEENAKKMIDDYTASINEQVKKEQLTKEAGEQLITDFTNSVTELANSEKNKIAEVSSFIMEGFKNSVEAGAEEVSQLLNNKLKSISDEFQAQYDYLINQQTNLASKLSSGALFEITDEGVSIEDLDESLKSLERYEQAIQKLKDKGISDSLLEELSTYSVDDLLKISDELLKMSDSQFQKLNENWVKKQSEATRIASEFYKEQVELLERDFKDRITESMEELPSLMEDIGLNAINSFYDGLSSKMSTIQGSVKDFANNIINQMQKSLNIQPVATASQQLPPGYAQTRGVDNSFFSTFKNFKLELPAFKERMQFAIAGMVPGSSEIYNNYSNNYNTTNNQGDLNISVNFEKGDEATVQSIFQQGALLQQQRALAKGVKK